MTPDKVLRALDRKTKGESPRYGPQKFPAIPYPELIRVEPPDPHDMRVGADLANA